jgi:hypothetical protein
MVKYIIPLGIVWVGISMIIGIVITITTIRTERHIADRKDVSLDTPNAYQHAGTEASVRVYISDETENHIAAQVHIQ